MRTRVAPKLNRFSIHRLEKKYRKRQPLAMFLTESMAAPEVKDGVFVVRARRPHPMIIVAALASFIVSRNRYASGDLAMIFGVFHFTTKSHIDVKRIYCRLGGSVSDTTARDALDSISASSMEELRAATQDAMRRGEMEDCTILDNVQEYDDVYEQGIGRQSVMKVGTAGTRVRLKDCKPGAFNAKIYYDRVALNLSKNLTVFSLFDDIDWDHISLAMKLHWVRELAEFSPLLNFLLPAISDMFRAEPVAKHRMRADRGGTEMQPLGTNGEHSTENKGMERAVADFDAQCGVDADADSGLLSWIRGDGASYAAILRLTKFCAPLGDKFKNKISTPEIWHTGATDLNSIAANHYGPATSSDPSSLSKCSNTAGLKRPSNIKSCDYYPTMRNLSLIYTAHVLDCWRVFFGAEDLLEYFVNLDKTGQLPTLDILLEHAGVLVDRYTSQAAIEHALDASEATSEEYENRVPVGTPWVAPMRSATVVPPPPPVADPDSMPDLVEIVEPTESAPPPQPAEDTPEQHEERPDFTGDRVLRNSEIFMTEFGWWIELIMAVPEGDIGRVWEILKVRIPDSTV
ncbi:hypothetical protein DFH06DRAFT_1336611 [Mycena polygramma]|nr:hypothetical protein DFH06DRAFT_1336611 [Mycena polygramma]